MNMNKTLPLGSLLLVTVILAFCSIIYQLLLAQTLTEIFGGSVMRYALTIGLYLFSMGLGVGAYSFLKKKLSMTLISLEIGLSIIGASIIFGLFIIAFASIEYAVICLVMGHALVCVIGFLSGMEIPFLVDLDPQKRFSLILGFDFIGTLVGSLAFPLLLYPNFSLFSVGVYVGSLNFLMALYLVSLETKKRPLEIGLIIFTSFFFVGMSLFHTGLGKHMITQYEIKKHALSWNYSAATLQELVANIKVVDYFRTPFQRVLVVEDTPGLVPPGKTLYLDKSIQLQDWWIDSYHETLSLLTLLFQKEETLNIAMLGGGDGILAHHLLTDPRVDNIDLIDIDKKFMDYMRDNPHYQTFHQDSLSDPKVQIYNRDAYAYLRKNSLKTDVRKIKYDAIILDLPGLKDGDKLKHLYSEEMFQFINKSLKPDGVMVTWHYRDESHQQVLKQTLWAAGFKQLYRACSNVSEASLIYMNDTDACIEYFMVANMSDTPPTANPQNLSNYQDNWLDKHLGNDQWETLVDLGIRAHSIFRPNYDLMPKKK